MVAEAPMPKAARLPKVALATQSAQRAQDVRMLIMPLPSPLNLSNSAGGEGNSRIHKFLLGAGIRQRESGGGEDDQTGNDQPEFAGFDLAGLKFECGVGGGGG